jgi:hypothetical protein
MLLMFLPPQAANVSSMDVCNEWYHKLPKMQCNICSPNSDAYSQTGEVTALQTHLPIHAADTLVMHHSDRMAIQ